MADNKENNFYCVEKEQRGEEYHVTLYQAQMGIWQARDTFLEKIQEGIQYSKLILGVEKKGKHIPIFLCEEGKFTIPDRDGIRQLGEAAETLLDELSIRFGVEKDKESASVNIGDEMKMQEYDIRITEISSKIVTVRAKSMEMALSDAHDNYFGGKTGYILDYDDLRETNFSMSGIHRDKQRSMGGR